ncbi:BAR adaptor protein Hob1 [Coemansia javaensis]|uniref:BAR adaptor protein Hob1 n=1 Tax=Coemansia javaensis TaxID=2761396 RepID=A0A9W8HIX8_9FUNG|nr:BAR adaptor protein Hob1 [Coemansia javaensis]
MSWKGFKKALERMPHQLQSKIGRGAKTTDPEFDDLQARFVAMEKVTKELFQQATRFRDGLHGLLVYQSAYLEHVLALYRPISTDVDGVAQPVGSYTDEGASPELMRMAEEFRNRVAAIRESTDAQLARLDMSVVAPIQDLMTMMRNIHKVIQKRDHKLLDYDRFKAAVEKAEAKEATDGQRRLGEERAYQKHGAQYQEASRQYTYFNDMLKSELGVLLGLRQALIDPIFLKFFRLQNELYTGLFRSFTDAARNCPVLDLTTPVLIGWQPKWDRANQGLHALDLWGQGPMNVAPIEIEDSNKSMLDSVKGTFRRKDKTPTPVPASSTFAGSPSLGGGPAIGSSTPSRANSPHSSLGHSAAPPIEPRQQQPQPQPQPPAYSSPAPYSSGATFGSPYPPAGSPAAALPSAGGYPPPGARAPPPPPQPAAPPKRLVRALYDFTGEEHDLSFKEGQEFELIERTADPDDWWTGRLNGRVGTFPGTYVKEL